MAKKNIPIPHIPLKFEEAVKAFLEVKPPKKGAAKKKAKTRKKADASRA